MSENFLYGNGTNRLYGVSDTIDSDSSLTVASTKCVNNVYNNLKELIDSKGGGLPLGHIYLWPFSAPPDGSIQVNGSTYNRELYSDLWTLIKTKGWYKSESEWQSIASANGGYCPWYSDGDGSTTFRTPKFAPYQKLALSSGDAGKYYEAGLPNITGKLEAASGLVDNRFTYQNGALYQATTSGSKQWAVSYTGGTNNQQAFGFDASLSNAIYGNSTTVRPESHDWIVCLVAFGTATNVGSVDVANVMSAVSQVQAGKLDNTTVHLVETWKSTDGASWYRKYSDGWIEQGGKAENTLITFPCVFNTTNYNIVASPVANSNAGNSVISCSFWNNSVNSTTILKKYTNSGAVDVAGEKFMWYACGY